MKKLLLTVLTASVLLMANTIMGADSAAVVTKTASPDAVTNTPVAAAVVTQTAAPSAVTTTAAPSAVTTVAVPVSNTQTASPYIEGVLPPAVDNGAYEEPGEPAPTAEETTKAVEKKSDARKNKHFSIEQTLYTPSSIGTKLGYFINENWRVTAEYSTIAGLVANSSHEKNASWALAGSYSPADDDWAPFYGAGFTMMDLYFKDSDSDGTKFNHTRQFTGGYLDAGVSWISDSILMASLEFDLYGGRTRDKKWDYADTSKNVDSTTATLSVMIGATVGLCF